MSKISDFVAQALKEDSNIDAHISFGNIYNSIAQAITSITAVDCKGSEVIITAYDVAHAFKRHGNHAEEKKRGQIGITSTDFELVKDILFHYDNIEKGKDMRNAKSLVFTKRKNNVEYTVVATIEGKIPNKKMVIKTMYKKP